jgi:hypothetical protein
MTVAKRREDGEAARHCKIDRHRLMLDVGEAASLMGEYLVMGSSRVDRHPSQESVGGAKVLVRELG